MISCIGAVAQRVARRWHSGVILSTSGNPIGGSKIEIWQSDHRGIYRHPRDRRNQQVDVSFHGYGVTSSDSEGQYRFSTIVPVPYTGRPPHIHVRISTQGQHRLTTQLYLEGHPENDRDGVAGWFLFPSKEELMIQLVNDGDHQRAEYEIVV